MARIYANWKDAYGEIKRDVSENGISVHTKTYQSFDIKGIYFFESALTARNWGLVNLGREGAV